jgi:hypothetical protein
MSNPDWVALFRQLPKEVHSQLVIVSQNRTDISVDTIFKLEPAFMVIRGRLGGTTETGLLFMVPYDQISSIFVNREIKENEVDSLFQSPQMVARLASASHQGANQTTSEPNRLSASLQGAVPRPAVAATAKPAATAGRSVAGDPSSVARTNLLERLRAARNAANPQNGKT